MEVIILIFTLLSFDNFVLGCKLLVVYWTKKNDSKLCELIGTNKSFIIKVDSWFLICILSYVLFFQRHWCLIFFFGFCLFSLFFDGYWIPQNFLKKLTQNLSHNNIRRWRTIWLFCRSSKNRTFIVILSWFRLKGESLFVLCHWPPYPFLLLEFNSFCILTFCFICFLSGITLNGKMSFLSSSCNNVYEFCIWTIMKIWVNF